MRVKIRAILINIITILIILLRWREGIVLGFATYKAKL
jgi:hypothetical protein